MIHAIRQGQYHENIIVNNKNGNSLNPLIFTNYNDERVVMNGTLPINSLWTLLMKIYGNIY